MVKICFNIIIAESGHFWYTENFSELFFFVFSDQGRLFVVISRWWWASTWETCNVTCRRHFSRAQCHAINHIDRLPVRFIELVFYTIWLVTTTQSPLTGRKPYRPGGVANTTNCLVHFITQSSFLLTSLVAYRYLVNLRPISCLCSPIMWDL